MIVVSVDAIGDNASKYMCAYQNQSFFSTVIFQFKSLIGKRKRQGMRDILCFVPPFNPLMFLC